MNKNITNLTFERVYMCSVWVGFLNQQICPANNFLVGKQHLKQVNSNVTLLF